MKLTRCHKISWGRGCYLTGALASEGVVEGAVDDAGVKIVLFGATPCLAHLILCLCPKQEYEKTLNVYYYITSMSSLMLT